MLPFLLTLSLRAGVVSIARGILHSLSYLGLPMPRLSLMYDGLDVAIAGFRNLS